MYALGFIETKGLVGAIEAADAMLKAADVFLVEKNQVGSGLVTITVAGEISAVQASVDAAVRALGRIEGAQLFSKNVIARHYDELSRIIGTGTPVPAAPAEESVEAVEEQTAAPVVAEVSEAVSAETIEVEADTEVPAEPSVDPAPETKTVADSVAVTAEEGGQYKISQLKKMKISRVRQIARSLSGISLTPEEVRNAPKKTLIDAIVNVTSQIEE
ncbi:BMC domain-containing protein [Maridesulfovibrio sp. FT414]|uniref:BMC domain-containing protein n=1 Tax=Maridesulfovibrio sp. FT414 TaxID=2979469 RepID=UPI003D8039CF